VSKKEREGNEVHLNKDIHDKQMVYTSYIVKREGMNDKNKNGIIIKTPDRGYMFLVVLDLFL
jgi:hypothetical protein